MVSRMLCAGCCENRVVGVHVVHIRSPPGRREHRVRVAGPKTATGQHVARRRQRVILRPRRNFEEPPRNSHLPIHGVVLVERVSGEHRQQLLVLVCMLEHIVSQPEPQCLRLVQRAAGHTPCSGTCPRSLALPHRRFTRWDLADATNARRAYRCVRCSRRRVCKCG